MPTHCKTPSEVYKEHPNGNEYRCPVCGLIYMEAVGLEFLNRPKVTITISKPVKVKKGARR